MSARRRDNTPPYEIMGSRPSSPPVPGRGPRPGAGRGIGAGIEGFFRSVIDAWQAGASEPLTLRVPRGMALALMAGVLGLVILAYWVGHNRGESAKARELAQTYPAILDPEGRTPPDRARNPAGGGAVDGENPDLSGLTHDVPPRDPRIPGNNYLILALYPPQEAQRLRVFLAEREVEVMIGPRNNKGLCQVIALRGFSREQMRDTDAAERYRNQLLAYGREWKAANEGRGENLSDMYYSKYEPPAGR